MYKIYADDNLIYDSTLEEYKIVKGEVELEVGKSGSFTFSIYPDHYFYNRFVKLKTIIKVLKDGKIIFRGRILNDTVDFNNNKVLVCEGELAFLQDSIIRPFEFTGRPAELFAKFVNEHNAQVDEFKRFTLGVCTVTDPNDYINRSNGDYDTAYSNMTSRLIEDSLGGYFYITHNDVNDKPTINYVADFSTISGQTIEFGSNLIDYVKTENAEDTATALIPLGAVVDDGDPDTQDPRLTITSVNAGKDYIYDEDAVALRGWIFKTEIWDDVTVPSVLKTKGIARLQEIINQNITLELSALDLHILDRSVDAFRVCDYIKVVSEPHGFNSTMLCTKQTIDLLNPANDKIVLGYTYTSFTETTNKASALVSRVDNLSSQTRKTSGEVNVISGEVEDLTERTDGIADRVTTLESSCPFPVGALYMSIDDTEPSVLWSGTTWERMAQGRTLVGIDENDSDFDTVNKTGGEKKHTLTANESGIGSHTHGMSHHHSHNHKINNDRVVPGIESGGDWGSGTIKIPSSGSTSSQYYLRKGSGTTYNVVQTATDNTTSSITTTDSKSGSANEGHNNLQPYITCYIWKRTA